MPAFAATSRTGRFFNWLLGLPMWLVVSLSVADFVALFAGVPETVEILLVLWILVLPVFFALRLGVSLWRGAVPAGDWLGALAVPHAFALAAFEFLDDCVLSCPSSNGGLTSELPDIRGAW